MKIKRAIISGGGTGGHIFPALAIAKEMEKEIPKIELLFIGAKNRMEMRKVPLAGYRIKGLWIDGFQRRISLRNLILPFKILLSVIQSAWIIFRFKPNVVIGTGGFVSGPVVWVASILNYPTLIQEQNSCPGVTNILLSKKVKRICLAYEGLDRYFPINKIAMTGNPIRKDILVDIVDREKAFLEFQFTSNKKVVLVIGGSLGARPINNQIAKDLNWFIDNDIQLLWQTGNLNHNKYLLLAKDKESGLLRVKSFIDNMNYAYSVADVIVSRAGALAISELCVVGKPVILIPSPYVTADHQTKNAMCLSEQGAAVLLEESDIINLTKEISLLFNKKEAKSISKKISKLSKPNATANIVKEILKVV